MTVGYQIGKGYFKKLSRESVSRLLPLKYDSPDSHHQLTLANEDNQNQWFDSLDKDVINPKNMILEWYYEPNRIVLGKPNLPPEFQGIFKITNINWVNRTADCGWDLFKEYRGQGMGKILVAAGTEFCFRMLNLRRLNAEILLTNEASMKCAVAAGYQYEGRKRQAVHSKSEPGTYTDSLVYGCLYNDWKQQNA